LIKTPMPLFPGLPALAPSVYNSIKLITPTIVYILAYCIS
jgi:hypothetical protein